jgi:HPt (histidine-containing phosphotransfer) domain-containing protein
MPFCRSPVNSKDGAGELLPSAAQVLDPDVMRAMAGDDPAVIRVMMEEFVPAAQSDIAEIRAAVDGAEAERVRMISHKLKGSSGLVGARQLVEICRELEAAGILGNWQRIGELMPDLDRLMSEIEAAAAEYLRLADLSPGD